MRPGRGRRLVVAGLVIVAVVAVVPAVVHLTGVWRGDDPVDEVLPEGMVDDASRLERTRVAEVVRVAPTVEEAIPQLVAVLEKARTEGLRVSIGGARHSMGGQTITPAGIAVDMRPLKHLELLGDGTLRVGAGAIWSDVVPYLDARGRSPAVMQSDNDFSVGGTISVGAHGWMVWRGPGWSGAKRLHVLTSTGEAVWCSRTERPDLFRHVAGGYGLFGIILEVDLETVLNVAYRAEAREVTVEALFAEFPARGARDLSIGMSYARLDIRPPTRFDTGLLTHFRVTDPPPEGLPTATQPGMAGLRRTVFRGSVGSLYGKRLRWNMERAWALANDGVMTTRNQQLSDTSRTVLGYERDHTDILHEYFVPPANAVAYLREVDRLVTEHEADLLNVTVRDVRKDGDAVLSYASEDVVAFVMLFHQPRTTDGEADMQRFTRAMIDTALSYGGRYYLPYRLHATDEQLRQAYPRWDAFVAEKRRRDPDGLLSNKLWERYAGRSTGRTPGPDGT